MVAMLMVVSAGLLVVGMGAVAAGFLLATAPPTDAITPTPIPVEAPATGGLAAVRARGALRVAADPDAAPFLSKTADGSWEGFEYGVMTAIAADAGVPLTIVPTPFSELDDRLYARDADLAIGQLTPNDAWSGLLWSISYLQYSHCLVVPRTSGVKGLSDLRGKRVGMYDDPTTTQLVANGVGGAYDRAVFDDYGYFEKLARGKLDAVVYDCPLARHELGAFGGKLRIVDDALNVATYSVASRSDDALLRRDVSRVLRTLGEQGLLGKLEERWLGAKAPTGDYATASGRVVVVRRGETLSGIAARELGSAGRTRELHEANRDLIGDDPDAIYAGLRLRIRR